MPGSELSTLSRLRRYLTRLLGGRVESLLPGMMGRLFSWAGIAMAGLMSFAVLSSGLASAAVIKPYFVVSGGDVFAGGWFNDSLLTCSNDPTVGYQAPIFDTGTSTYNPVSSQYNGAILGFNKLIGGNPKGAAVDFGAMAMGLIEGNPGSDYGFASGITSANNSLSFANNSTVPNYWGGLLAGSVPQTHCLPDYYNTKQNSPASWPGDLAAAASGQYKVDTPGSILTLNSTPKTISKDKDISLFVKGDVYIGANISYDNSDYSTTEIPHFTLIVLGNIYIDPAVTSLDGFYIAQPDTSSQATIDKTGVIWTCHANSSTDPTANYVYSQCDKKLIISGALSAKQVDLLRVAGDLDSSVHAEAVVYTPQMVIGGPFFNQPASTSGCLRIESLVSLPPVF